MSNRESNTIEGKNRQKVVKVHQTVYIFVKE